MKNIITKSLRASLFLSLTGFLLTSVSCRCDLEEDKENTADNKAKNIKADSLLIKKN